MLNSSCTADQVGRALAAVRRLGRLMRARGEYFQQLGGNATSLQACELACTMAARLKAEGAPDTVLMIAAKLGWDAGMHADIDDRVKMEKKDKKQEARIAAYRVQIKKLTAQLREMRVVPEYNSSDGESEDASDEEEEEGEEEEEEEEEEEGQQQQQGEEAYGDASGGYEDDVSSEADS